jgi:hypothetical protein
LRLHGLQYLVLKKAGPSGQGKNLIRREDVLDALDCEPEDLFPADTRFIDVGPVVERTELAMVEGLIGASRLIATTSHSMTVRGWLTTRIRFLGRRQNIYWVKRSTIRKCFRIRKQCCGNWAYSIQHLMR